MDSEAWSNLTESTAGGVLSYGSGPVSRLHDGRAARREKTKAKVISLRMALLLNVLVIDGDRFPGMGIKILTNTAKCRKNFAFVIDFLALL
jgi:hypothetical protein